MTTGVVEISDAPRWARDGARVALLGLAVRLAVVAWAAPRFPPAEDGQFYHVVATRIARGLGYTWLWPDGAVTYAAHYPVGYPGLVGALYATFGPRPVLAMLLNAALGAASVWAVHRVAAVSATRAGALVAALALALHPALVFYTPALMTEGAAGSLLALAAACTVPSRLSTRWRLLTLALALGAAAFVRPQSLLLAPLFGYLSLAARPRGRILASGLVMIGAIFVCLPWTVRNCHRMERCVLLSANSGWNLFIGSAKGATGTFVPLERLGVPAECRTVWGEAEKDECFGTAARREIREGPGRWLSLVPSKLAHTFDYAGAAGWYLHASNPAAFSERAKWWLGAIETLWERTIVLLALLATLRAPGTWRRARQVVVLGAALCLLVRAAWLSHVGLLVGIALLGRHALRAPYGVTGATLLATAFTHAVYFGAGRYSLVCIPLLAAMAGAVLRPRDEG